MGERESTSLALRVSQGRVTCPFCGGLFDVGGYAPDKSGFWAHYFSKKHAGVRPKSEEHSAAVRTAIMAAKRAIKKAQQAEDERQRREASDLATSEAIRLTATYPISGGMLDEVIGEMERLIWMMEPYYSQCDADKEARVMIKRINAIMGVGVPAKSLAEPQREFATDEVAQ